MAKKNDFTVVRNGEHIAVCATKEIAENRIKNEKSSDIFYYEKGWTKAEPDTISYFIITR